jgi:hypothetical protein
MMLVATSSIAEWLSDPPDSSSVTLPALIYPVFALCVLPYLQVRQHALLWQFDNPQAALLPGYRAPHLLFIAVIAVITMVIVPGAIAALVSISPWFLLAVCALLGVVLLFPSMTGLIVPLVLVFQLDVDAAIVKPWLLAEGFRQPAMIAIVIVSWLTIGLRAFDASSGREEGTRLPRAVLKLTDWRVGHTFAERSNASDSQPNAWSLPWSSSRLDRQISRMRGASVFRKVRIGMTRSPAGSNNLLLLVPLLAVGVVSLRRHGSISLDADASAWFINALPFCTLAAALAPAVGIARRLPQMAFERLLPMSNQTLADALIFNAIRFSAIWWLAAHGAALAALRFLPWQDVASPSIATIAVYAFISISGLVFSLGLAVNGAMYPGFLAASFVGIPSVAVCIGIPGYWSSLRPGESSSGVIVAAAIVATFGVALLAFSRTNWSDREFGLQNG